MVQVISNLGTSSSSFGFVTVVHPVLVSIGFAVVIPLIAVFICKPVTLRLNDRRAVYPAGFLHRTLRKAACAFIIHSLILIGLVTAAAYAGTSNLFAAYIAGAVISWWDSQVSHPGDSSPPPNSATPDHSINGVLIYEQYYQAPVDRILKPFFFVRARHLFSPAACFEPSFPLLLHYLYLYPRSAAEQIHEFTDSST